MCQSTKTLKESLGHGNESYRFASTARVPQKQPLRIFIILKKIHYSKKKLFKASK